MVERTLISFPSQLQLIERLQHLIYLSSSMIFLSGEEGSGKSTLIEQLSNQLPNKTQQAFISLSEPVLIPQIRQKIISQLFIEPLFDADDRLSSTLLLLSEKQSEDVARVVVIDNAQLLPEKLLIELAEIIQLKSTLTNNEINFILLADEQSNNKMMSAIKISSKKQHVATLPFKLTKLSFSESQKLLNHALSQVNYSPEVHHQDALAKQLLRCNGVPEKILALARNISSGELEVNKSSWLTTRLPAIMLMLLSIVIASSLVFYLYPAFIQPKADREVVIETDAVLLDEIDGISLAVQEEASIAQSTELLAGQWSSDETVITDNQLSVGVADSETQRIVISDEELRMLTSEETANSVNNTDSYVDPSTVLAVETDAPKKVLDQDVVVSETLPSEVEIIPILQEPSSEIQEETVAVLMEDEIVADSSVKLVTELILSDNTEQPVNNHVFSDIESLLAVDETLYTLQLSGMASQQSLQEFIQAHQLPQENIHLYQTIRYGKPWYVVIYGQFKDLQSANRASRSLPDTFSELDSWAKKYLSVHQDLQLNEQ